MNYFYFDFETPVSKTLTISKMTLRQYLYGCAAMGGVMGMSYALNDEPVRWLLPGDLAQPEIREGLAEIAASDDWTFVAHNAAFDVRVWRFLLNLPQPKHVHCTMEFAYAAWPCHPGGYGLGNLSKTMNLGFEKLGEGTKVMHMTPEQLALYCCNDTELCRAIHKRALTHLCADEIAVAELCNAAREMFFEIDQDKLAAAQEDFVRLAQESAEAAVELLGDDGKEAFGWDGSRVRSVKPEKMKRILLENFGFDTHSISVKKINPMKLGTSTGAMQVLKATERTNKSLSHSRRVAVFQGSTEIDVELGYYRAHTGRFSSPQPGGKGVNIHNCVPSWTPVLTDRGWICIVDIAKGDKIWDGAAFVQHGGVVAEGKRTALTTLGLSLTPEHPIWTGRRMVAVGESTPCQRVLALVAGCLSNLRSQHPNVSWPSVVPAPLDSWACRTASLTQKPVNAAEIARVRRSLLSFLTTIYASFTSAGIATCSTDSALADTESSAVAATGWSVPGSTELSSSATARLCLDGMTWLLRWTGCVWENPTGLGTSDSFRQWSTRATADARSALMACLSSRSHANVESRITLRTTSTAEDVYDLLDCGKFQTPLILISNCPKRDKRLAKAIRSIFRLPDYACFVRADFANVEYRMEGWLTGCQHVYNLFERDPNADPYAAFWFAATGKVVTKADPARQIAKAAVLGLGYGMGIQTWIATLLLALADPTFGVSLSDLNKVCEDQGWGPSGMRQTRAAMTKLNAPWQVATVAEKTREMFHQIHPEFSRTARWLVMACEQLNRCGDIDSANRTIDRLYELPAAPRRDRIGLSWTDRFEGRSVRVTCGHWAQPTVTWRDIDIRPLGEYGGIGLTNMHGTKGYRGLSPQITIENVVQSASRNALCTVQLDLRRRLGYEYQLSVHDEALLAVERTPQAVIEAKKDLIDCVAACGYGWAVHVDPTEVNVSQSLYEADMGTLLPPIEVVDGKPKYHKSSVWWDQLATHPELLENLP